MKRALVLILGIYTILNIVLAVVANVLWAVGLLSDPWGAVLLDALAVSVTGLQVFYVVCAVTSERLTNSEKAWWTVGLFLCGGLAMPSFWHQHLWKTPKPQAPPLIMARARGGSGKYLIHRTDAEWFAIAYDRMADVLKPMTIPSRVIWAGTVPRFEVEGAELEARHDTNGVNVLFYKSDLPPEREMEIVRDILANIARETGAKGDVVAG